MMTAPAKPWVPDGAKPQRIVVVGDYIGWLAWDVPTEARPSVDHVYFAIYDALPVGVFAESRPEAFGSTDFDGYTTFETAALFSVYGAAALDEFFAALRAIYDAATDAMGGRKP